MPVLDSVWGYTFRTLTDTGATPSDSEWGYQEANLSDPSTASDSTWGYWGTVTLRTPHHPVTVLLPGNIVRHVPIQVLIGGVVV